MYTSRRSPKWLNFLLGYEAVYMKLIAKESRLAVGTLYNYYSKKWIAFRSLCEKLGKDFVKIKRRKR